MEGVSADLAVLGVFGEWVFDVDGAFRMIALLLFSAAANPAPLTLHCEIFDDGETISETIPDANGWDARLTVVPKGKKYDKALIDGPPLFSSYKGLTEYSAASNFNSPVSIEKKEMKAGAWKVSSGLDRLFLDRRGSKIMLTQISGQSGSYEGVWTMADQKIGHITLAGGGGELRCQTLAQNAPISWDDSTP